MSDNVKDELAEYLRRFGAHTPAAGSGEWVKLFGAGADIFAPDAAAILAPDSPLVTGGFLVLGPDGEPLDVRPALRLQGRYADLVAGKRGSEWLAKRGLSWQLADACLAAAEVEG